MNFLVRFLLSLSLIFIGQTHLRAHTPQYDITRVSTKTFQDTPLTDHCRIKQVIITTSPSRKDRNHNEIEIPSNENREEDENDEDENERGSSKKHNYFSLFFYAQAPVYFSAFNAQYLPNYRNESLHGSKYLFFQVLRI